MNVEDIVVPDSSSTPESDDVDECFPKFDDPGNKPVEKMTRVNLMSFHGAESPAYQEGQ